MNFGLIFVFLRSSPIIEVPRGTITPPFIELKLTKTLLGSLTSKLVPTENWSIDDAVPFIVVRDPAVSICNPGLLSIVWVPVDRWIEVLSNLSLSLPGWYEKRAASIKARWIVLKGRVLELPVLLMSSVASSSSGLTYITLPGTFLRKFYNLLNGIYHQLTILSQSI